MADFTNKGLVAYCKAMLDYRSPYWYGTFGQIANETLYLEKKKAYPDQYNKWSKASFSEQYGKKVHDCSGLIKGYFMTPGGSSYPTAAAKYDSKYDLSSSALEARATEKGPISTIPEIPGLIVWKSGHVGVYIGNQMVIEERGHTYGTVMTKITERPWEKWLKHPFITYEEAKPEPQIITTCTAILPILKRGIKDSSVKRLQAVLNTYGYDLEIDGSFGGKTEAAVIEFQKSRKLKADGIVGAITWAALFD